MAREVKFAFDIKSQKIKPYAYQHFNKYNLIVFEVHIPPLQVLRHFW
ncbi:MAG: hypothetical protein ACJAVF_002859 [Paraglaciecola sp.]|jgi:hypothetical protein